MVVELDRRLIHGANGKVLKENMRMVYGEFNRVAPSFYFLHIFSNGLSPFKGGMNIF
jgi:hypothetical protein